MAGIQPELSVRRGREAIEFYNAAFGAVEDYRVCGTDAAVERAVAAGATVLDAVGDEHGWRPGRIVDPFGHPWEIGRPLIAWPPAGGGVAT